jgi:hypothetical protein
MTEPQRKIIISIRLPRDHIRRLDLLAHAIQNNMDPVPMLKEGNRLNRSDIIRHLVALYLRRNPNFEQLIEQDLLTCPSSRTNRQPTPKDTDSD